MLLLHSIRNYQLNFLFYFYFFTLFYFTILYWFCHTSTWICHRCTRVPIILDSVPSSLPTPSLHTPQSSGSGSPASCIGLALVSSFAYANIHVSMPFSQIIPPSPSPTESKRLFCTSVSLLLSRIQGYHYHLSKFHIYVLVYCIGVFFPGLLHSV